MPLLILPLLLLVAVAFFPLVFVLRFRVASARRQARPWVTTLNATALTVSAGLLLISASILNVWVPNALRSGLVGLGFGILLSLLGLAFIKWERTPQAVFYKPNRWFALLIPLALTVRIAFWAWRGWHVWATSENTQSWLAASGTAGSVGIGGVVAGYYLGYAVGVWRQARK